MRWKQPKVTKLGFIYVPVVLFSHAAFNGLWSVKRRCSLELCGRVRTVVERKKNIKEAVMRSGGMPVHQPAQGWFSSAAAAAADGSIPGSKCIPLYCVSILSITPQNL